MNIRTFVAKSAIWFSENEGGGSKTVWNFSENSFVLVTPSVPKRHHDLIILWPGSDPQVWSPSCLAEWGRRGQAGCPDDEKYHHRIGILTITLIIFKIHQSPSQLNFTLILLGGTMMIMYYLQRSWWQCQWKWFTGRRDTTYLRNIDLGFLWPKLNWRRMRWGWWYLVRFSNWLETS